ncbi:uncharacterized protein YecE (DUF72 family) [Sphingomonas sp. F9_3S_D5_B_2]
MRLNIGTAGWSIPRDAAAEFAAQGSGLERYASRFPVAEINSSFHRSHRRSTWERWAENVPADFRFSAKIPKTITHQLKLRDCADLLGQFIEEVAPLGPKLAVLLVQLPPKLAYDAAMAETFFAELAARSETPVACEPRNGSWFTPDADQHLTTLHVARVAADPACCDGAERPGGWRGLSYWRLHGSPVKYRSSYSDRITSYAAQLTDEARKRETWCIFDNTASSAAAGDALTLIRTARLKLAGT